MSAETPVDTNVGILDPNDPAGDVQTIPDAPVYYLRPSDNKARLLLDCPSPMASLQTTLVKLSSDIKELNLPESPDLKDLEIILTGACADQEHLWDHTLIMGVEPVPPNDAELIWSRDFFAEGWQVDDESSSVDFWQKNEKCSVRKNELLARHIHATDGEAGQNIFGEPISVGKSQKLKLRSGKGLSVIDEGPSTAYYAEVDGRLRFKDNTIAVDDLYVVKGDVCLETGNITHTGSVTIEGDVQSGATITTEGDLLVKGLLEPCDIKCGGTLVVAGGIIGDADHTIVVDGSVEARYINEANITAYEGVIVSNEIVHSHIKTLGSVEVPAGRITGGETIAYKGIKIGTAGASGIASTILNAGLDITLESRVNVHLKRVEYLERTIIPVQAALTNACKLGHQVSESIQKVIDDLGQKRMKIGEAIAAEYMVINDIQEESKANAKEEIIILKEVWSGATFLMGKDKLLVKVSVMKPRIVQHQSGRVRMKPLGMNNMPTQ